MERHLGIGIDWNILDWICWHWNLIILYNAQIYQLMLSCQHGTTRDVCISTSLSSILTLQFPLPLWIRGSWLWNLFYDWPGLFLSRQLYPPKIPGTHFWSALLWCRSLPVPEVLVFHEEQVMTLQGLISSILLLHLQNLQRFHSAQGCPVEGFSYDCVSLWDFLT